MKKIALMAVCILFSAASTVFAQNDADSLVPDAKTSGANPSPSVIASTPAAPASSQAVGNASDDAAAKLNAQLAITQPNVNVDKMPSLFFSVWQHDLITAARSGLNVRPPGIEDGTDGVIGDAPREIVLAGIVYTSKSDWTIWLNNMRVSPGRIPSEVMDLKVYKNHIDLEWFDSTTNQIFPIRLRAHQRFNLDSRIFLPGA